MVPLGFGSTTTRDLTWPIALFLNPKFSLNPHEAQVAMEQLYYYSKTLILFQLPFKCTICVGKLDVICCRWWWYMISFIYHLLCTSPSSLPEFWCLMWLKQQELLSGYTEWRLHAFIPCTSNSVESKEFADLIVLFHYGWWETNCGQNLVVLWPSQKQVRWWICSPRQMHLSSLQ